MRGFKSMTQWCPANLCVIVGTFDQIDNSTYPRTPMKFHVMTLLAVLSMSCASPTTAPTSEPNARAAAADDAAAAAAADASGLWILTTIAGRPALAGSTLELSNGKVAGNAGCNSYNTAYTITGSRIAIGELIQSGVACEDMPLMNQESAFLSMLGTSTDVFRTGDSLTLQGAGGELVFSSAVTREPDATWKLELIYYSDGAATPIAGRDIMATFTTSSFTAELGCNTVSGTYSMNGNLMKVSDVTSTAAACGGPDGAAFMAQEKALAQMLESSSSFTIEDDRLLLYNQGYRSLQWTLSSAR